MSYLDYPRIHFSGLFQASPSTVNNTPNNYVTDNWNPKDTELYWNPNGNGIFDLVQCTVTATVFPSSKQPQDNLHGKPVVAVYTKAPPKVVDLDPMQQNVTEIWGLVLQIGDPAGDHVQGVFDAFIAFFTHTPSTKLNGP